MSDTSFTAQLRKTAQRDIEIKIRKVGRRLAEVEALPTGSLDAAEAEGLSVAIRQALVDGFGFGSFAYNQYRDAADFYSGFSHLASHVDIRDAAKARSVALLKRAAQSLFERFEGEFPDATIPAASRHLPLSGRGMAALTLGGSGVAGTLGSAPLDEFQLDAGVEVRNSPPRPPLTC
jgi:hypothetical protein